MLISRHIFAVLTIAVAAAQSDIPDTGLGPPNRQVTLVETRGYRALLSDGNSAGSATVNLSGHRASVQQRIQFDIEVSYTLAAEFPAVLRIQRGGPGMIGPVVLEVPLQATDLSGSIRTKSPPTAGSYGARAEIMEHPERFYVNLYAPGGNYIRGQLKPVQRAAAIGLMTPGNEVPAIQASIGSASGAVIATVTRNAVTGAIDSAEVEFDVLFRFATPVTFTGLHVHSGAAEVNGPVILDSGLRAPPEGSALSQNGALRFRNAVDVNRPDVVAALEAILSDPSTHYINVHTTDHPGGALRGQLRPTETIELPAAYADRFGSADRRIADATLTLDVLRERDGTVAAAVVATDLHYADYPVNVKFNGDLTGDSGAGTGHYYTAGLATSERAEELAARLQYRYGCVNVSAEGTPGNLPCEATSVFAGRLRILSITSAAGDVESRKAAPGSLISIFGSFPGVGSSPGSLVNQPWPFTANAMEVTIGDEVTSGCQITSVFPACKVISGQKAPLAYTSREQINVQVPFQTRTGSQPVRYWNGSSALRNADGTPPYYTAPFLLTVVEAAPAIFLAADGPHVYSASGVRNVPDNAAAAGDVLTVYVTGLGQTTPPLESGVPAPVEARRVTGVEAVMAGVGIPALSAQAVPGSVGLYTVAFQVPSGLAPGTHDLRIRLKGENSNLVKVWVRLTVR